MLSGWLITTQLLAERARTGTVHLRRFYLRRAARLYPALVVTVTLALLMPTGTGAGSAVWALLYVSDVVRSLQGGMGAIGHTWSLSVEEHFYLAWPLALLWFRSRRSLALAAGVGTAGSFALLLAADGLGRVGDFGYNSTLTRAWGLGLGCLLTCAPAGWGRSIVARRMLGVAVPVASVLLLSVYWQVAHVMTTTWVIAFGSMVSVGVVAVARHGGGPLSWPPLPWLGRISYGLYLFHFLPISFVGERPWPVTLACCLGFALPVAWATDRWVETPIRRAAARGALRIGQRESAPA